MVDDVKVAYDRGGKGSDGKLWANTLLSAEWFSVLSAVKAVAESTGVRVYLVGGIVRQAVFSVIRPELVATRKNLLDIDFAVEGDFETFISDVRTGLSAKRVSRSPFLTAVCDLSGGLSVDFAQCRTETYRHSGALPEVKAASLELDAVRRDFSVNAMYLSLDELFRAPPNDLEDLKVRLIDYVGGLDALKNGIVEILHDRSIFDDPTRIFRAVRYRAVLSAFSLDGKFGSAFLNSLQNNYFSSESSPLAAVSHFRKWVELRKCFESSYPVESIGDLIDLNIFDYWPPVPPDVRSGFIGKLTKLLTTDSSLLSTYGFLMYVAIWWWTNIDAISNNEHDRSAEDGIHRDSDEDFLRARNELRLNKGVMRAIEKRQSEDLESIDWLKKVAEIYYGS